jgi:D-3-phosphoglycerate dehydrogenase
MARPIVLCTLPLHAAGVALLDPVAEVRLASDTGAPAIYEAIGEADLLLVRSQLPADLFERPNRLLGVIRNGTGLDMIPVASATAHGIPVANVPGANVQTVAEYCVAGMLAMTRKLAAMDRDLREHGWNQARIHTDRSADLHGKTIGIVGLGAIGLRLAEICHLAFGMRVLGYQPRARARPDFVASVPLDDLLAHSDFVSLNCPLNEETRHLLDERRLNLMKPGAILVNAARGAVVEEAALAAALAAGRIGGAVLDVFSQQPLPRDSAFLALDKVLLTPHAAGLTPEAFEAMSLGAARQMLQILVGEMPRHIVNPEVWEGSAARRRQAHVRA